MIDLLNSSIPQKGIPSKSITMDLKETMALASQLVVVLS